MRRLLPAFVASGGVMVELCVADERSSTGNGGQPCHPRDRIVPRKFAAVAKVLWRKPAAAIADIAKVNIRTAKRILRGEAAVPAEVIIAANAEMLRPIE